MRRCDAACGTRHASSAASRGRRARSVAASSGVSGISRAPWRDLGATVAPFTIARRTCRCGAGSSRTRSLQRRPIASEIRSPVAASSSNNGRHLAGTSSSRRTSSARVRKRRSRVDQARPARCCSVATSGRSPPAANSLRNCDSQNAPDRIRTCDLRFRRPTLYPAELRAQRAIHVSRQRRGRDSNPRWNFWPHTRLAGECLQPLGHLSGCAGGPR